MFENNVYIGPSGPNDSRLAKQAHLKNSDAHEILREDAPELMQLSKNSPLSPKKVQIQIETKLTENGMAEVDQIRESTNLLSPLGPSLKKAKVPSNRIDKCCQTRLTLKCIKKEDLNQPRYVVANTQTEPLGRKKDGNSKGTEIRSIMK